MIVLTTMLEHVDKYNSSAWGRTTIETLICPSWETSIVPVSQPGTPGRDKRGFVPGLATGTKGAASATCLAHPFVPVGVTNRDKKVPFFHVFLFSILFLFQLYFCISIKLMYWNSVCMISTNIYIPKRAGCCSWCSNIRLEVEMNSLTLHTFYTGNKQ